MKRREGLFFLISWMTFLLSCSSPHGSRIGLDEGWKFMPGDDPSWSSPAFSDSAWKDISPLQVWDAQGYADLDGYAWYRIHVTIPSSLKERSYYRDSVVIFLGKIDDRDQTWLNGQPLGQNGVTLPADTLFPRRIPDEGETWARVRKYTLAAGDPRIHWDDDNVIAVRVWDRGGLGGMYGPEPYVAMVDVAD